LGKPSGASDLKLGLSTAPVIFAAGKHPDLKLMMERKFSKPGDVEIAFQVRICFETLNYFS
jgi:geranylgeranyl pyrophosphate synthase